MRALLVQARSPSTYWSYDHSLPFLGKAAALPPLGLATLAALLPTSWELRLVDLHVEPLRDCDLAWADAVLVSGMLVQSDSIREVLERARQMGKRTVVGGPAPTTSPDAFPEADHVFRGEAEGRLEVFFSAFEEDGHGAPRILSPEEARRPSLQSSPVPRFDLIDLSRYASLAVQASRGCPFRCEFCDIIEVFGRVPRLKSPEQILAELDEIYRLGGRGSLFFVDDNFIGNRREIAKLLPKLAAWQEAHGRPFDLYTEASLDLADEPALLEGMVAAGFSAVFVGIESPSEASLRATGKLQNLRTGPREAVARLTTAGLEVFAGFIVGFDEDDEGIFDQQIALVENLPIPRAMVGLLSALPGTALWRRLEQEGRLRRAPSGDQFERPNFEPRIPESRLLAGYRRVLAALYSDEGYYARCRLYLERVRLGPAGMRRGWLRPLLLALWQIGVLGARRGQFWRLLRQGARRGLGGFGQAVALAILGEHLIRYTQEVVLPRLDRSLALLGEAALSLPHPEPASRRAARSPLLAREMEPS
ncbi:MAG TPA: radical SAM protein [Anaeromyxobacteraceae bacterium]|nr:radical SAM protein [Anaeromyxobacteraceae bacterium]